MKKNSPSIVTSFVRYIILFIFACVAFLTTGSLFQPALWAQNSSNKSQSEEPLQSAVEMDKSILKLIETAQEKGVVRVIIGLKTNFKLGADLTRGEELQQVSNIKQAQADLLNRLSPFHVQGVKQYDFIPFLAAEVDAAALLQLRGDPQISSVTEDRIVYPTLQQSVPLIQAPQAWSSSFAGSGWAVAILDTGVAKTHPFLNPRIVAEACYSTNATNSVSLCPGGVPSSTVAGSGLNCVGVVSCEHGTHVAGIAAGNGANSGVAKDANVVAIQVFSKVNGTSLGAYSSDIISGLQRVFQLRLSKKIVAANMSLGGGLFGSTCNSSDPAIYTAIDKLRVAGVATVIASGNNGATAGISFPGCMSNAISVGSTNDAGATVDDVSSFSNNASFLSLLAPGANITSSFPTGGFATFSGTSMAAPHVAGAWAVLKQSFPRAPVQDVYEALATSGKFVIDTRNPNPNLHVIKPRIRLHSALQALNHCRTVPFTIPFGKTEGWLSTFDCFMEDSRNVDVYQFSGTAGQRVYISMLSPTFDTYLYLTRNNLLLAQDDNGGGGTNSRIPAVSGYYTLPATATYTIWATSNSNNITGIYTINIIQDWRQIWDWNRDGQTDFAVFRPGNGEWHIVESNTATYRTVRFGSGSDRIVPADYTGDGKLDIAIWRPVSGEWFVLRSEDNSFYSFLHGASGDIPIPSDYDGDGIAEPTVFRPSDGTWNILSDSETFPLQFGTNGDVPVAADYDADGIADIAVYRPSTGQWWLQRSSAGFAVYQFGSTGDKPVPADYDGDEKTDVAIWRPATGDWWVQSSVDNSQRAVRWGLSSDIPAPGDYDGDGKADFAVFRPSSGTWYVLRSTNGSALIQQFGAAGDQPIPSAYIP